MPISADTKNKIMVGHFSSMGPTSFLKAESMSGITNQPTQEKSSIFVPLMCTGPSAGGSAGKTSGFRDTPRPGLNPLLVWKSRAGPDLDLPVSSPSPGSDCSFPWEGFLTSCALEADYSREEGHHPQHSQPSQLLLYPPPPLTSQRTPPTRLLGWNLFKIISAPQL